MEQYLCIAATFLSESYHGQEWPPCPARLFQALLAGAKTGAYQQHWEDVEPALKALERQSAPEMVACDAVWGASYSIAVPNNDSDKAGREWAAGREYDPSRLRTIKSILPRRLHASSETGAHVYYMWPISASVPTEMVRKLTSFLHTFGWGIDMAYADSFLVSKREKQLLVRRPGYAYYKPADKGRLHNIPAPGYLHDLTTTYNLYKNRQTAEGVNPAIRSNAYAQQAYITEGARGVPYAQFVLRRLGDAESPFKIPWGLGMQLAAWLRHAAAEALRQERYKEEFINSYVLGHGNGHDKHLSFVPIPTIGSDHSDGFIRRAMILEPDGANGEVAQLLQLKLSAFILRRLVENGNGPRQSEPACQLFEPQGDNMWHYYTRSSHLWQSVTPVVLHGYNSAHGKFSLKKTEQLLYQAFEKSGYLRQSISQVFFQPAPFWAGTEGALAIRVPEHLKKWPRYHVSIRFNQPVTGPLVVGIGKHYGVGVFAVPRPKGTP